MPLNSAGQPVDWATYNFEQNQQRAAAANQPAPGNTIDLTHGPGVVDNSGGGGGGNPATAPGYQIDPRTGKIIPNSGQGAAAALAGQGAQGGSTGGGGTDVPNPFGDGEYVNAQIESLKLQAAQQASYQAYLNAKLNLDTDALAFQKATQAADEAYRQKDLELKQQYFGLDQQKFGLQQEQQQFTEAQTLANLRANPRNYLEAQFLANARGGLGGLQPNNQIGTTGGIPAFGVQAAGGGAGAAGTALAGGAPITPWAQYANQAAYTAQYGPLAEQVYNAAATAAYYQGAGQGNDPRAQAAQAEYARLNGLAASGQGAQGVSALGSTAGGSTADIPIPAFTNALLQQQAVPSFGSLNTTGGMQSTDALRAKTNLQAINPFDFARGNPSEQQQALAALGYATGKSDDDILAELRKSMPQFTGPRVGQVAA